MRICLAAASLLVILCLPPTAPATTIYVDHAGGGAYLTIQEGINAAGEGDTVLVAPGVYKGASNKNLDFGGTNVILLSEIGPDSTIIDCEGSQVDPHRGVYLHSSEDSTSVIRGFTITNGYQFTGSGAGIYLQGTSPTISNCIISYNTCFFGNGAGLSCDGEDIQPDSLIFIGNHAENGEGGGVYAAGTSCNFTDCAFTGNTCYGAGGGVYLTTAAGSAVAGCTFTDNEAGGGGGGMIVTSGGVSVVSGSSFTLNTAGGSGGGIQCSGSAEVIDCYLAENTASNGGGIAAIFSEGAISDCIVFDNQASSDGGGIWLYWCSTMVTECDITHNTAGPYGGGGVACWYELSGANCIFENVTIAHNATDGNGGGMLSTTGNASLLSNVTFFGNGASGSGGAFAVDESSGPVLNGVVLSFSTGGGAIACIEPTSIPTLTYCDSYGNIGGDALCGIVGVGNIFEDPLFCDSANDDFTLCEDSPCLEPMAPNGHIGRYGQGCGPCGTAVDDEPLGDLGSAELLVTNAPNPFGPNTTVFYHLRRPAAAIELTVHNLAGRRIRTLYSGPGETGEHSAVWNGKDEQGLAVASGIYFYSLRVAGREATGRAVLIR